MTHHTLKLKKPLAVIDLETTGINITKDRIVTKNVTRKLFQTELLRFL